MAETEEEKDDDNFHDDWNIAQADDDHFSRPHDECVANARLIAAAPDLLAACKQAYSMMSGDGENELEPWQAAMAALEAAMDKAEPKADRQPDLIHRSR